MATDTDLPYTNTDLHSLVINELTKVQYDELAAQGNINENELYIVTDAETAIIIEKEGGALVGDGTSGNPLDISKEFKTQLSGNIEALNKEIEDRTAADATLQTNINSEAETRANRDTELQGAIESEVETRESEIARVEDIVAEEDEKLQQSITTEVNTRKSEITRVEGLISSEAATRYSEDTNLTNLINSKTAELESTKQDNLIAGDNIAITGTTISATYTAGDGIDITDGVISNTRVSAEWGNIIGDITTQADLQEELSKKQDNLTAGTHMEITNNTISTVATQVIRRKW